MKRAAGRAGQIGERKSSYDFAADVAARAVLSRAIQSLVLDLGGFCKGTRSGKGSAEHAGERETAEAIMRRVVLH